MADVKWIKIATGIFDDEKILLIESMPEADAIIVIWFKLLTLAGKQNNDGIFILNDRIPYTEEMLATIFRRPLQVVRLAINVFEQFGMIEIVNDTITIPSWEKHQNIDGLEKIREQNRKRVAKYREKQKLLEAPEECNVTVTQRNETDKNRLDKNRLEKNIKHIRNQIPPTREMVSEYIAENHYRVDADAFMDYYESKGWLVGKTKMKDWQATVRNWNRKESGRSGCSNADSQSDAERYYTTDFGRPQDI